MKCSHFFYQFMNQIHDLGIASAVNIDNLVPLFVLEV